MSDDIEWTETDDNWSIARTGPIPISDVALYGPFHCRNCGNEVQLYNFDPDADGPSWSGSCSECDLHYRASPSYVTVTVSDTTI